MKKKRKTKNEKKKRKKRKMKNEKKSVSEWHNGVGLRSTAETTKEEKGEE